MLEQVGIALATRATVLALEPLVRDILQVQDQQLELLRSLSEDVAALRRSPWELAQIHLREFIETSDKEFLDRARDALYDALSKSTRTAQAPMIAANLALVLELQGKRGQAAQWARRSFELAEEYVETSAQAVQQMIRTPTGMRRSIRNTLLSVTPPSIEWLWWKNEVTSENDLPPVMRKVGSQAYFVPVRLGLRPAIEAGAELPRDPRRLATALGLQEMSWLHVKTVLWTLELPAIQRLYTTRKAFAQLPDYRGLCSAFGVLVKEGTFLVDLSTQKHARVQYQRA